MKCSKCKIDMNIENYKNVEVDRCPKCNGTWLDIGELNKIVNRKEEKFSPRLIHETLTTSHNGVPINEKRSIVLCPKCFMAMDAINYDYCSGIIIDSCTNYHGVWLDSKELEKIQAHREHWEKEAIEHQDDWMALVKLEEEKRKKTLTEDNKLKLRSSRYIINSIIEKLLGV